MSDFASSRERALEKNAEKIRQRARSRIEALTEGLGTITSFNPEKVADGDPGRMLNDYRGAAHRELKAIMAREAAKEAAAKAGSEE